MQVEASLSAFREALGLSRRQAGGVLAAASESAALRTRGPAAGAEARTEAAAGRDRLEISPEARALLQSLQAQDAEVRAHEHAHSGAGGALTGAPSFEYQKGPDGRLYAVGGEVPIQVKAGGSPAETLRIAAQARRAALAPAQPSAADMGVAASASALEMQARREMAEERTHELTGRDSAGRWEAVGPDTEIGEGGSFDPRVRDYGRSPAPAGTSPSALDIFG